MAAAGQQAMTQEELNKALWDACGHDNDLNLDPTLTMAFSVETMASIMATIRDDVGAAGFADDQLPLVVELLDRGAI